LPISHKWGTSRVAMTNVIGVVPIQLPPVTKRFETKYNKFKDARKNMQPGEQVSELLALAEWALGHGLMNQFREVMDDLVKTDAKHPSAVAFTKIKADLEQQVNGSDDADAWQKKLPFRDYRIVRKGHYALLHNYSSDRHPSVESRLKRLEDTLDGFFYWFALKAKPGMTLPEVPKQRLGSVLVAHEGQFEGQQQIFDPTSMVADGFRARSEKLPVFSGT